MDWKYISGLGEDKAKLVEDALSSYQDEYITVNQLCENVENVLGIKDYPIKRYITDKSYSFLPQDINRWISLLAAIGAKLPEYVSVIDEEAIDSVNVENNVIENNTVEINLAEKKTDENKLVERNIIKRNITDRTLSDKDRKYLLRKSIPWIIVGLLIVVFLGVQVFMTLSEYITMGTILIGGNVKDMTLYIFILCILISFGGGLIFKGVKILSDMPNMLVKQVDVTNIVSEKHTFFYRAEFKMPVNGKNKTMFAPVAFGDVSRIRNTCKAMLYYVPNKSYLLGKCEEMFCKKTDIKGGRIPKPDNLLDMDGNQRVAVLRKIRNAAWIRILESVLIPCGFGLGIYFVLNIISGRSNSTDSYIMMACFGAIIIFLYYIECFVKSISRLFHIKELKKGHIYWVVVPVTQCTRSVNIFERWYRYAHYIYGGKPHKDWMLIGKYPIDKVTCLVSEKDTSQPYAYMHSWFKGILY